MSYLDPPPLPAPVVVTKDFGGLVTEYQARTEEYRASNREVRVHECHSACTLALSLPNVCVYPDSIFKFHQAYNLNNHVTDAGVSEQLFDAYPIAVRAHLGTLTRSFKIMSGAELIKLGIRDCNEPRIMVATAGKIVQRPVDQDTSLSGMMHGLIGSFTGVPANPPAAGPQSAPNVQVASREPAKPAPSDVVFADYPLPPARPPALTGTAPGSAQETPSAGGIQEGKLEAKLEGKPADVPLPPERPASLSFAYTRPLPVAARLRIIGGAAPILSSKMFVAYAVMPK